MIRVSEHYQLNRTQPSLDFVDVYVDGDLPVFVDPRALRLVRSAWGDECISLVQDFFSHILFLIKNKDHHRARQLLGALNEPNETRFGLSKAKPSGRGLGKISSYSVWQSLKDSEAVKSGLLEDLEDTILMVEGIAADIISDIVINLIRAPLIEYTQQTCQQYGIALEQSVSSGPLWDPASKSWYAEYVELPVINHKKLLFVPKVIVRQKMDYNLDEFYRHYILEALEEDELSANTGLVHLLKDGKTRKVLKKDLIEKYGRGKTMVTNQVKTHPQTLELYRQDKADKIKSPLNHSQLSGINHSPNPDWLKLLDDVLQIPAGKPAASQYEDAIEKLLTALFYPGLTFPKPQHKIHQGRKRVDIDYTNTANLGFFSYLSKHYPSAHVFVEAKNYKSQIANPELDQLAGRFSPSRGKFGILVCRRITDKELFIERCRDTVNDNRGYIVPLDDDDLTALVQERLQNVDLPKFEFLFDIFSKIIS